MVNANATSSTPNITTTSYNNNTITKPDLNTTVKQEINLPKTYTTRLVFKPTFY